MAKNEAAGPAVEVEKVSFNFDSVNVLDGLSLQVPRGVSFGLLGPNGAGKTTLIRLLVGLLKPKSGQVLVLGRKPSRETSRLTGYMPQLPSLYAELSVKQNVDFFAQVYRVTGKKERERRVEQAVRLV